MPTRNRTDLARDAFLNLARVHDRLSAEFAALFRAEGLTMPQFNVLRILLGGPREGAPCQYVGERLLTRVPDVTRLIDRMEAAGLVRRSRAEEDRRVVLVHATAKGRTTCEGLAAPVRKLHRKQFEHVSLQTLEALDGALEAVLAGLDPARAHSIPRKNT